MSSRDVDVGDLESAMPEDAEYRERALALILLLLEDVREMEWRSADPSMAKLPRLHVALNCPFFRKTRAAAKIKIRQK